MVRPRRCMAVLAGLLMAAGTGGCERHGAETFGRRLDDALARVQQQARETGSDMACLGDAAGRAALDGVLTVRVKTAILGVPALRPLPIRVVTRNGVAILTGAVPTAATRQRVSVVVAEVRGVQKVENRLAVGEGGGSVKLDGSSGMGHLPATPTMSLKSSSRPTGLEA